MEAVIDVLGIGAEGASGLRPQLRARIDQADFLAGGERHLSYFPAVRAERFVIRDNLTDLVRELQARCPQQCCVVLASGDPLFYGIGTYLLERLPHVRVEPAISSMQLAFARAGISWQDAALGSIHGRDLRSTLLPLLGQRVIGLFTQDGYSPAAVAQFFLRFGLSDYQAVVGENLGGAEERICRFADLQELANKHFAPLNYLILQRSSYGENSGQTGRLRCLVPGVPDEVFARPDDGPEVMTRQEVRSVVVGKLCMATVPGDTCWDIGAGLGTVSVEIAVLRPHVAVVAVERDPARAAFLQQNRQRFGAYNIRVVKGVAPEVLAGETDRPCRVFLGGSGGRLPEILELVQERLLEAGRLVATFVTLEHLTQMLERVRAWRWPFEITEIHVARSDSLSGLTGLKPQRAVFLVQADKPTVDHE